MERFTMFLDWMIQCQKNQGSSPICLCILRNAKEHLIEFIYTYIIDRQTHIHMYKHWFYIINYLERIIQWVVLWKVSSCLESDSWTPTTYLTPKLIPGGSILSYMVCPYIIFYYKKYTEKWRFKLYGFIIHAQKFFKTAPQIWNHI